MSEDRSQLSFHVLLLVLFTAFCILLDVIVLLSNWSGYIIFAGTILLGISWFIHFARLWDESKRLYFLVFCILVEIGLYATHGVAITDIPMILVLLIVFVSIQNDRKIIYLIASSYVFYFLEVLIFTNYINSKTESIVFSRIILGIVCIMGATLISNYFIRVRSMKMKEMGLIKEELKEAKKENEMFLSNMSHELRTPINAVTGVSEILLNESLSENIKNKIEIILSAGRRLSSQVSDMLIFSEIQTGHITINNESYEPITLINDAVSYVFSRYKQKKLDFAIDVDYKLPKALYGDEDAIKKILICILDNANKFTDDGGGQLLVSGRKEYYGINLNIDLYDTGCGITEKQKNMLFGGVYLGNINEERKIGGLGLGIAIVEGLVNRMNGFIKIDSVPEKGTHIHISIPQKIANPEPGITMDRVSECNIIAYFNREKYTRSEVGAFYYELLNHAIDEFHFNITSAGSLAELKELFITMSITHVFIASWEYGMDPEYFESLAKHTNVCIFTHHDFKPLEGSCCDIIYKPIYVLSVIDYLKNSLENNFKREETNKSDLISVERPSFKGKRALVVDDDEMNLIVAKGILESMDVDVITCLSGDEAIEKCGITDFDIIFMDYMMPVMNGTKAMKHIREIRNGFYKEVPILVLTANAVSGAREEFMQAGFDEFISKPIDIIELGNTMKAFL